MVLELCWRCKQMKPDVALAATDDRLCHDCCEENERQLIELGKQTAEEAPSHSKTRSGRQAAGKKQVRKAANKPGTSDAPEAASAPDVHHPITADIDWSVDNQSVVTVPVEEFNELRLRVHSQQTLIDKLQGQLNFVLSFLDIKATDADKYTEEKQPMCEQPDAAAVAGSVNGSDGPTWTEVVSRKPRQPQTLQQSVVAAVYVDQTLKKRHEASVIVSGLQPSSSQSDADIFAALCDAEFQVQPDIATTKRLGQPQNGRTQLMLVMLKQVDQAKQILSKAKTLRRSANDTTRRNVFINPYMTRAEATAAYQMRVQRRVSQQRRNARVTNVSIAAGDSNNYHPGQPPVESCVPSIPNSALLDYQATTNNNKHINLNPYASSFNSTAASPATATAIAD